MNSEMAYLLVHQEPLCESKKKEGWLNDEGIYYLNETFRKTLPFIGSFQVLFPFPVST